MLSPLEGAARRERDSRESRVATPRARARRRGLRRGGALVLLAEAAASEARLHGAAPFSPLELGLDEHLRGIKRPLSVDASKMEETKKNLGAVSRKRDAPLRERERL